MFKHRKGGYFPGGPVVRTRCFHCQGLGLIPGQGTKTRKPCGDQKKKKRLERGLHIQWHTCLMEPFATIKNSAE